MDNYDLSNLPLLGHCADSGENHPWLTDQENRRATFSRRPTTITTPEQAERQQPPSTGDEQITEQEQRVLADFDISFSLDNVDPLVLDEPVVGEPEDPFAALAAYRPLTFDDNSQNYAVELGLGLLEGFTDLAYEDITDVVVAEPEENDIPELFMQPEQRKQSEQSLGESEKGIVVPDSANSDTVPSMRSRKRRAPEPENAVIGEIPESAIKESQRGSMRPTKKRQKLNGTDTELLSLSRGTATRRQFSTMPAKSAMPKKSATPQKSTAQNPDESFKERVKKETAKWVVRLKRGIRKRFMCGYANCGDTFQNFSNLRSHIFSHTGISMYKCTYPKCGDSHYFRDTVQLQRHIQTRHTHEKPHHCTLCDKRFGRSDTYKRHMFRLHKLKL